MPFDASTFVSDSATAYGNRIASQLRNFYFRLGQAVTHVNNDNYTPVLASINTIRAFEAQVQEVIAAGLVADVVAKIASLFANQHVTTAGLNAFRTNLNAIRAYLIANASAFPMTYDASDNIVFVTSPGGAIKTELLNRINAALNAINADS